MTAPAQRSALLIAFHFPPLAGSSGIQRTLRFVQHLPTLGWRPLVLTAQARAYEHTSTDLLAELDPKLVVERAFALDTARHLAVRGRYWRAAARPDRWASWRFDAVRQGLRLIDKYRPSVIWSTYPIATAHRIGAELQRRSGLPWVADFRDPMAQVGYPADPVTWAQFADIERGVFTAASACTFTTPGAMRAYAGRFPDSHSRLVLVENGYDEESFAAAQEVASTAAGSSRVLLHSGIVYPEERDPRQLLDALALLRARGALPEGRLIVRFRAAVHDDLLRRLASERRLDDVVQTLPAVGYRDSLQEMMAADGLLLLQAANCNEQIPAKLYEYLRAGRPILACTDAAGDTAAALRDAGVLAVAPLDDAAAIAGLIANWLDNPLVATLPTAQAVRGASRRARSEQLAALFESLTSRRSSFEVQPLQSGSAGTA